uniref:Uncharacterized protein n=1 Tax=Lepeophtheirus salmonis TaxID=72036 RepID=A0A0K2U1F4_LEPSM
MNSINKDIPFSKCYLSKFNLDLRCRSLR